VESAPVVGTTPATNGQKPDGWLGLATSGLSTAWAVCAP
jgi:hypothetical protein